MADDVLRHVKDGHSLAHAIVDTVREALIVLDRDLRVVAASRSFYQTFGANPQDTQGRTTKSPCITPASMCRDHFG